MSFASIIAELESIAPAFVTDVEAIAQSFPAVGALIVSLAAKVGVTGINWAALISIIGAALETATGNPILAIIAAILRNLPTVLTAPAATSHLAAAALAEHIPQ